MRVIQRAVVCVAMLFATTGQMQAGMIVNGGFESGLTDWSFAGDAGTVGAGFGSGPIAGSSSALLTTGEQRRIRQLDC